jgi:protein arginine N-methyltransferase 2
MADQSLQETSESDILLARRILSAASRLDLPALKIQLKDDPTGANVRDPSTGTTPLHEAIASGNTENEDQVVKVVEYLFENGAIWNDLNKEDDTPGCVALKKGLKKVYETMVKAGVRAELLFGKLSAMGLVGGNDDEEDEEEEQGEESDFKQTEVEEPKLEIEATEEDVSLDNHQYLKSQLRFREGILLDSSDNAVMMDWETTIMKRHATTLLTKPGLRAMNVGHGLGIVDTAIQSHSPAEHHIIEAHPQVLARLRQNGWYEKPGVRIHEGRWQDILPKLAQEGVILDAIYYDTFAEDYAALKEFFSEWVVQLMDEDGKFGWYNGLGADRQICYDVYTKVSSRGSLQRVC